jgi:hypothetical protein
MGVRKGDMIGVLNEHEPTWSILALLLPITAVLGSEDAADVLVTLSTKGYNGTSIGPSFTDEDVDSRYVNSQSILEWLFFVVALVLIGTLVACRYVCGPYPLILLS